MSTSWCVNGSFPKAFSFNKLSAKQYLEGTDFENTLGYVPGYLQHVGIHKTK